jgi:predicted dienelactone hydrolase
MHQFFLLAVAALASATPSPQGGFGAKTGGTGKYGPVSYAVSPQFPGYTVYVPPKATGEKLPVILWANGMCSDDGSGFASFLLEVSSHGYIIIANGAPGSGMSKQAGQDKMKKALEIVEKQAGTGVLANADITRIAAAGQSCGGMNTYLMANEPRIKCIGIFDGAKGPGKFKPPVGFFVGGTSDMAWSNVSRRH